MHNAHNTQVLLNIHYQIEREKEKKDTFFFFFTNVSQNEVC